MSSGAQPIDQYHVAVTGAPGSRFARREVGAVCDGVTQLIEPAECCLFDDGFGEG